MSTREKSHILTLGDRYVMTNAGGVVTPAEAETFTRNVAGTTLVARKDAAQAARPGTSPFDLFAHYEAMLVSHITTERALTIRQLRRNRYSWGKIAETTAQDWGPAVATWSPAWDPIAGAALVKLAADKLNQDYDTDPWN